jgi:hypothetical protein
VGPTSASALPASAATLVSFAKALNARRQSVQSNGRVATHERQPWKPGTDSIQGVRRLFPYRQVQELNMPAGI